MKTLFLSWDRLGDSMAGSAIRSLELARAVARAGVEVTVAAPAGSSLAGDPDLACVPLQENRPPLDLVAAQDSVFLPGRMELMTALHKPLAVDLYDPFVLSNLDFFGDDFDRGGARALLALRWLEHHLRQGDLFLCASETQRRFWLGMLASAGRLNRANYEADPELRRLLQIVPFGIGAPPPAAAGRVLRGVVPGIEADDRIVLWAGGMWNWVDPLTLIRAAARLHEKRSDVKVVLLGARHPNPEIGEMQVVGEARALAERLDPGGERFFFLDWIPYERRHLYLQEADLGVSLHRPGVEAEFAFRTRVLDYIWADVPMVLTAGDDLSDRAEREGLARLVGSADDAAVAAAIDELLANAEAAGRRAAFEKVRASLAWDRVAAPLVEFCRAPWRAADAGRSAWVAGVSREDLPGKSAALVTEEFVGAAQTVSPDLHEGHVCRQRFRAAFNGLTRIDVRVSVEGASMNAALRLELHSVPDASQRRSSVLARVEVPVAESVREGWQRFEFRPVLGARGHDFEFVVSVPEATRSPGGPRICLQYTSYPEGGGVAGEGSHPAFLAHYLLPGVVEECGPDADDFVFRHNTTLPLLPAGSGGGPVRPADGSVDASDLRALQVGLAEAEARSEALAREVQELRERVPEIAQHTAHVEVRYRGLLFLPFYEMLRFVRLGTRAARGLVRALLTVLLVTLGAPLALVVGLAMFLVDRIPAGRPVSVAPGADEAGEAGSAAAPDAGMAAGRIGRDSAVSIVIPTWNGRELLEMSLPPLAAAVRAHGHPEDEILVMDNASEDDTIAYLEAQAAEMPFLRWIRLESNEGFAGATNCGAHEARNAALLLLNNDMVVEEDFIAPLLEPFTTEHDLFGVSCQIDFIDPTKPRWETGKVHARFEWGCVRLFHLDRFEEDLLYPVFFAGGGASLYDRARFLALGGFDEAVFSPVYIEDADLGYRAWRRGWPSVMAPRSRVHHKHRGTTRRRWSEAQIHSFFTSNLAALVWKNVRSWRLLLPHLAGLVALPTRVLAEIGAPAAFATVRALWRQVPTVMRARHRENAAHRPLGDEEVFELSRWRSAWRGRYPATSPGQDEQRPQVLVVSPYSPVPALHGGAVRISNLLREAAQSVDITLLSLADTEAERSSESLAELGDFCRDAVVLPRDPSSTGGGWLAPGKLRGFFSAQLEEEIREWMERRSFAVVQVEYTHMAHFLPPPRDGLRRILVEHDVSFVALERARRLPGPWLRKVGLWMDGLRTFRHEVLAVESADRTLTMSETDRDVLARYTDRERLSVVPNGVDCRAFPFSTEEHEEDLVLFVGFFRHEPNVEAALHFAREILPLIHAERPEVRFRIVGAYAPPAIEDLASDERIEVVGRVPETASEYRRAGVFVAPVLRGSGTRLKILEAMASGAAVVSTAIGAEGIDAPSDAIGIADGSGPFAAEVLRVLGQSELRATRRAAARRHVEKSFDWPVIAGQLLRAWGIDDGKPPREDPRE